MLSAHAPETSNRVGVGVAKYVPHVQRAADGGWRRIDCKYIGPFGTAFKRVSAFGFPPRNEFGFKIFEGGFFRHIHRVITVLARNWA